MPGGGGVGVDLRGGRDGQDGGDGGVVVAEDREVEFGVCARAGRSGGWDVEV